MHIDTKAHDPKVKIASESWGGCALAVRQLIVQSVALNVARFPFGLKIHHLGMPEKSGQVGGCVSLVVEHLLDFVSGGEVHGTVLPPVEFFGLVFGHQVEAFVVGADGGHPAFQQSFRNLSGSVHYWKHAEEKKRAKCHLERFRKFRHSVPEV